LISLEMVNDGLTERMRRNNDLRDALTGTHVGELKVLMLSVLSCVSAAA
jgi:hypothetical protein